MTNESVLGSRVQSPPHRVERLHFKGRHTTTATGETAPTHHPFHAAHHVLHAAFAGHLFHHLLHLLVLLQHPIDVRDLGAGTRCDALFARTTA